MITQDNKQHKETTLRTHYSASRRVIRRGSRPRQLRPQLVATARVSPFTQTQLATMCGTTRFRISRWFGGAYVPRSFEADYAVGQLCRLLRFPHEYAFVSDTALGMPQTPRYVDFDERCPGCDRTANAESMLCSSCGRCWLCGGSREDEHHHVDGDSILCARWMIYLVMVGVK